MVSRAKEQSAVGQGLESMKRTLVEVVLVLLALFAAASSRVELVADAAEEASASAAAR